MALFGLIPPNIEKLADKGDIDGLIKALNYKKDPKIRRDAAKVLGEKGDSRAIEPLLHITLYDETQYVRYAGCWALGKIGDENAVNSLFKIFNAEQSIYSSRSADVLAYACIDGTNKMHKQAVEGINHIGITNLNMFISSIMKRSNRGGIGRQYTNEIFKSLGTKAIDPLIPYLNDPEHQFYAVIALTAIKNPRVVDEFYKIIKDKNYSVLKREAIYGLKEIGDDRSKQILISALNEQSSEIIKIVAESLGDIGDAEAVEPLIAKLSNTNPDCQKTIIQALGKLRDSRAVEPLMFILDSKGSDKFKKEAIVEALGEIGDNRSLELLQKISSEYPEPYITWDEYKMDGSDQEYVGYENLKQNRIGDLARIAIKKIKEKK